MLTFYVADTETTGLKADYHEIIQLSIIRCSDQFQLTANVKPENPNRASPEALQIQGKSKYDLHDGISRIEAIQLVEKFIAEDNSDPTHRCIVGHNVPFDRRFFHAMWATENKIFPANLWLCTKEFTRKYAKKIGIQKPKLALNAALEMAGINPKSGAHNAVIDTINTFELWQKLMSENLNHVRLMKNIPHQLEKYG